MGWDSGNLQALRDDAVGEMEGPLPPLDPLPVPLPTMKTKAIIQPGSQETRGGEGRDQQRQMARIQERGHLDCANRRPLVMNHDVCSTGDAFASRPCVFSFFSCSCFPMTAEDGTACALQPDCASWHPRIQVTLDGGRDEGGSGGFSTMLAVSASTAVDAGLPFRADGLDWHQLQLRGCAASTQHGCSGFLLVDAARMGRGLANCRCWREWRRFLGLGEKRGRGWTTQCAEMTNLQMIFPSWVWMAAFFPLGPGTCLMVSRSSMMDVLWCVSRSRLPTNCAAVHLGACGWQSLPVEPRRPLQGPDGSRVHLQLPRHSRHCRTAGAWRGQDSCPAAGLAGTPPWRARAFPPPSRFSKHPELGWLGLDRFRPPTAPQTRDKKRRRGWILSQHLFRTPFFLARPISYESSGDGSGTSPVAAAMREPCSDKMAAADSTRSVFFRTSRAARQLSFC